MTRTTLLAALLVAACKNDLGPVDTDWAQPDADADADADSDADVDADTDADVDSDADADTDADTDSDTDVDCLDDASEPNDAIPTAWPGSDGSAFVVSASSPDYWRVDLPVDGTATVTVDFLSVDGDIDLFALGPTGAELDVSDGVANTEEVVIENTTGLAATYYVKVELVDGDCQTYAMSIAIDAPPPCAEDAFEDNDTTAAALAMPAPGTVLAVTEADPNDHFSFFVPNGATRTVNAYFTHAEGDIDIRIRPPVGPVVTPTGSSSTDDETTSVTNSTGADATYTVHVELMNETTRPCNLYTLEVIP